MKDKAYNKKDLSFGLSYFQSLLNERATDWTSHLTSKEVAFVYDMVSKANSFADFTPTSAQAKYIVGLASKIKLVNNNKATKTKIETKSTKGKKLSQKPENIARRKAIAFLKGKGLLNGTPSHQNIANSLFDNGFIKQRPAKKEAIKAICGWYKSLN